MQLLKMGSSKLLYKSGINSKYLRTQICKKHKGRKHLSSDTLPIAEQTNKTVEDRSLLCFIH